MSLHPARWWHREGPSVECDLCPRGCRLEEGRRGLCGVREARGGELWTAVFGCASSFQIDPMEKKPLYHFLPGTPILSFGTAGCTLGCTFCQNAQLSHGRENTLGDASVRSIVETALEAGCASVAFTYNEPAVSLEWTLEVAQACREAGLRTVAVTSAHVNPEPGRALWAHMDAANVDLKAFSEAFYQRRCGGRLQPVLDHLAFLAQSSKVWLEVTTLLIPGLNDGDRELQELSAWLVEHVGPEVPLHFSAFHPAHLVWDRPPTPLATLVRARQIALDQGLVHVYLGNLRDSEGSTTWCPDCRHPLILRDGFRVLANRTRRGACPLCGRALAGHF